MLEYKVGKKLFISIVGSTEQKYGDVMISFSIRMEKQRLDLLFCKRKKEFESARLYRSLINAEINSFVRWEIKPLFFFKRSKIGRNGGRPTVVGSWSAAGGLGKKRKIYISLVSFNRNYNKLLLAYWWLGWPRRPDINTLCARLSGGGKLAYLPLVITFIKHKS